MTRVRDRRNKFGRRGGPNRCGHDKAHFVTPERKLSLPPILNVAARRLRALALPHLGGYQRRSEREEAVKAVVDVMLGRTDVRSWRVGRPSTKRPRWFDGLSVDHDLARLAQISESRIWRVVATLTDWGWLHFHAVEPGRRRARRGFLRCAAQPIERKPNGDRRGRAAVRVWTHDFWKAIGVASAMADAQQKLARDAAKQADVVRVPVRQLVADLADVLSVTGPGPRPPP